MSVEQGKTVISSSHNDIQVPQSGQESSRTWIQTPMTDLIRGRTFTVQDLILQERPVIIHTFAVWCPACSNQMRETTRLVYDYPDLYTNLAIDIDPRDDPDLIKNHALTHGFSGIIVRAPESVSRELIQNLGDGVSVSLPQTLILCNGTVTTLGDRVFPETALRDTITNLCI